MMSPLVVVPRIFAEILDVVTVVFDQPALLNRKSPPSLTAPAVVATPTGETNVVLVPEPVPVAVAPSATPSL